MAASISSDYNDAIAFNGLNCTGNETHVFDCPIDSSAPTCSRYQDANVYCPGKY